MSAELPTGWSVTELGDVAHVKTGVAKNRRLTGDMVELPYLRVANVQDGWLDLTTMKTIAVRRSKAEQCLLKPGDVLFTEGGDYDKLGRGCVWNGEVAECTHQNHVFVVRTDRRRLLPEYLAAYASSRRGRHYFFKAAKKSTNLASINSNQLRSLPIRVPPMAVQETIGRIHSIWREAAMTYRQLLDTLDQRREAVVDQLFDARLQPESRIARIGDFLRLVRDAKVADRGSAKLSVKLYGKGVVPKPGKKEASRETTYYRRLAGQFIYSKLDFLNGAFGVIPNELDGLASTPDLPTFEFVSKVVDPTWLVAYVSRPRFYRAHRGLANGGRKARRVGPRDFLRINVFIPSLQKQQLTVRVIAELARERQLVSETMRLRQQQCRGVCEALIDSGCPGGPEQVSRSSGANESDRQEVTA